MFDRKKKMKIETTNESFESWINEPYISPELKNELTNSNVLFVPEKVNMGELKNKLSFYSDMLSFHDFLQEKNNENLAMGICIEEEDYSELILHSDILRLGEIIVEWVILPLLINYLYDFIKIKRKKEIQVKLNVHKAENYKKIDFEGSSDDFKHLINNIDNLLKNDEVD